MRFYDTVLGLLCYRTMTEKFEQHACITFFSMLGTSGCRDHRHAGSCFPRKYFRSNTGLWVAHLSQSRLSICSRLRAFRTTNHQHKAHQENFSHKFINSSIRTAAEQSVSSPTWLESAMDCDRRSSRTTWTWIALKWNLRHPRIPFFLLDKKQWRLDVYL